jgi:hypothetical protein
MNAQRGAVVQVLLIRHVDFRLRLATGTVLPHVADDADDGHRIA